MDPCLPDCEIEHNISSLVSYVHNLNKLSFITKTHREELLAKRKLAIINTTAKTLHMKDLANNSVTLQAPIKIKKKNLFILASHYVKRNKNKMFFLKKKNPTLCILFIYIYCLIWFWPCISCHLLSTLCFLKCK